MRRNAVAIFIVIATLLGFSSGSSRAAGVQLHASREGAITFTGGVMTVKGQDRPYDWYVDRALRESRRIARGGAYEKELYEYGISLDKLIRLVAAEIQYVRGVIKTLPALTKEMSDGCSLEEGGAVDVNRLLDRMLRVSEAERQWKAALEQYCGQDC